MHSFPYSLFHNIKTGMMEAPERKGAPMKNKPSTTSPRPGTSTRNIAKLLDAVNQKKPGKVSGASQGIDCKTGDTLVACHGSPNAVLRTDVWQLPCGKPRCCSAVCILQSCSASIVRSYTCSRGARLLACRQADSLMRVRCCSRAVASRCLMYS